MNNTTNIQEESWPVIFSCPISHSRPIKMASRDSFAFSEIDIKSHVVKGAYRGDRLSKKVNLEVCFHSKLTNSGYRSNRRFTLASRDDKLENWIRLHTHKIEEVIQ
jgi:hypothetical protein